MVNFDDSNCKYQYSILMSDSKSEVNQKGKSHTSEVKALCYCYKYRSGTVNSNTVNSKFHLIRSFFEIFARFLSFHV